MAYQVIARRWRPQDFNEVVSQEHVSRTLRNSIKNNRISHAYLFTGPRGVGKTTMARILAKCLNCVNGPTDEPCGVCESCLEIKRGQAFDVIEIDGASNNSVDDIRELRENVSFAPIKGKYKVYIIDEVHMLSNSAFNALLKTLEEPPSHVVFVFATTEYHKVPETILSRCQKYFFQKISIDAIVSHLKNITIAENVKVDEKALYSIARCADGAMRDAQSLLDQVIAFSEGQITEEDALSILGIVSLESYVRLLSAVADCDAHAAIAEASRVVSTGADVPRFVGGFVEVLRAARLVANKVAVKNLLGYSEEEVQQLQYLANLFAEEELGACFKILERLQVDLRLLTNDQAALEMALLDMIAVKKQPSLAEVLKKMSESAGAVQKKKSELTTIPPSHVGAAKPQSVPMSRPAFKSNAASQVAGSLQDDWQRFVALCQRERAFIFFKLNEGTAVISEERGVLLQYSSAKEALSQGALLTQDELDYIKVSLKKLTGKDVEFTVAYKDLPPQKAAEKFSSLEQSGEQNNELPETAEMIQNPELVDYEIIDPLIAKVKEKFYGEIVKKED